MLFKFIRGILRDRKNGSKILNKFMFELLDSTNGLTACIVKRQKCTGCYYYDIKKDFCMYNSKNPRWDDGKVITLCGK
ncbi:hypothetical protein [Kineothrix sedimenti]|uniref:Uncharacterized protein n=1 Tax=Kineothrix sedimenti TaxID=3123317 RepID=A0ABZ3F079_9FIRM